MGLSYSVTGYGTGGNPETMLLQTPAWVWALPHYMRAAVALDLWHRQFAGRSV